jgi:hypothetical protein
MGRISTVSLCCQILQGLAHAHPDTPEQQKAFADDPELFLKYSKMIESELNVRFKFILKGTKEAESAREVSRSAIDTF